MNADSWAIFHLRHLTVSFMPEAKYVFMKRNEQQGKRREDDEVEVGLAVSQNLTIRLGSGMRRTEDEAFAVVLQVENTFAMLIPSDSTFLQNRPFLSS